MATIKLVVINLHTKYNNSTLQGCREICDEKSQVWKKGKKDKYREE